MTREKLTETRGAWDLKRAEKYLVQTVFPIRLATLGSNGSPLVTSVWYLYDSGLIWCAVQEDSDVAGNISKDNRCGFEVGPNHPPYDGGKGAG